MTGERRRPRARIALVACLLWLAGFEVLPWLHVALHDELAPHIHTADGTIVVTSFAGPAHRHADGTIHRYEPVSRHRHRGTAPEYGLDHGAGSLAHHGVAAMPSPLLLHRPLPVDFRPTLVTIANAAARGSALVPTATARGPPAAHAVRV